MSRMKWVRDGSGFRSGCGRFIVRRFCMNPKWAGYWGLTDTHTGKEYPCRTEQSAKTAARNLLIADASNTPDDTCKYCGEHLMDGCECHELITGMPGNCPSD